MIYSFGLLLPVVSTEFGAGKTEASLAHTLMSLMTLGSGPVVAEATKKFGHRVVSMAGTLLAMAGLAAAGLYISLTNEPAIEVLYLCVGILTGFGFGLMYLPAMDIVERYFHKRLGLANGIAAAGSGLGQFIIAPLLQLIQQNLGLADTLFCLVGLVAIALPFVLIYKTPSVSGREGGESENAPALDDEGESWVERKVVTGWCGSYLSLLRCRAVLFLLTSYFLLDLGISSVPVFTTDRAEGAGIPGPTASYLLSTMGATNCLGRALWGPVMDRYANLFTLARFPKRTFLLAFAVFFTNACSVLLGQLSPSLPGQLAYSALFGASFGAVMSCIPALIKKV